MVELFSYSPHIFQFYCPNMISTVMGETGVFLTSITLTIPLLSILIGLFFAVIVRQKVVV